MKEQSGKRRFIVTIGGGTGSFMLLGALKEYPVNLTAIVSMADDGGSTGRLRDEYGVLPPGDIRRALVALSDSEKILRDLFNFRFNGGELDGHSFGNLFLAALEKITKDFGLAVDEAAKILGVKGKVVPVTLDSVRLSAQLKDGTIIKGETNIDIPRERIRSPIAGVWLTPKARLNPEAKKAIREADLIIIGPGDLYTSLIPNLLIPGMPDAIRKSKARKLFIGNLMTKPGETDNFIAQDFVFALEKYLGKGILDFALFNSTRPLPAILQRYAKQGAKFVDISKINLKSRKPRYILEDLIEAGRFIRHSTRRKLATAILSII